MSNKIVAINSTIKGSTGGIMNDIACAAREKGFEYYTATGMHRNEPFSKSKWHIYIGDIIEKKIHLKLALYSGYNGCFSQIGTLLFLRKLDKIHPNIIHIHNLHNGYINLEMLFNYINKKNIPVVWTLHDCWSFTGHCPYFELVNCDKWKTHCVQCEQFSSYPYGKVDKSYELYELKKRLFTIPQVKYLIAPSKWIGDLAKQSFMKKAKVQVIYNGIDLSVFYPRNSNFREKHQIGNRHLILGVANVWDKRKGLIVFKKLARELGNEFYIVVVGGYQQGEEDFQAKNFLHIDRTYNQDELAEIYSCADIFVNPTLEEVFGLVNAEALACGTPVITYNTGGTTEIVNSKCGIVVEKGNYAELKKAIEQILSHPFRKEDCIERGKTFSKEIEVEQYLKLYDSLLKRGEK